MDVELHQIYKTFGTVQANIGIDLVIKGGTIQGILGENGAGKSTLMKILSGFIQADAGEIYLNGKKVTIESPSDAIRHGIGMLHQDPLDFPPMQVIDNFLIGHAGGLFPDRQKARKAFIQLCDQFGFNLRPDAYVDSLTVGERQQLEIVRLLWLGVEILILDEPTTGISAIQKSKLFSALRKLAAEGKAIIFVSHKLEDVEELCTKVAVLRRGKLVGEMTAPYDTNALVEMMFGRMINLEGKSCAEPGDPILELREVCIEDHRLRIEQVNLCIRAGEVIGMAGMEGSGQDLLLKVCAGLIHPVHGKILIKGKDRTGVSYLGLKKEGVAYMPASRLEEGLIAGLTIAEHGILADDPEGIFINRDAALSAALRRIENFSIRGKPETRVEALSGGNQQRTLLALLREPLSLLLLEHPTRGLDIESTIYIWKRLKERCNQGTSILFISPDLEEILQYSDRIIVFYSGKVSPLLETSKTNIEQLGQLIGGKGWDEVFREQEIP